MKPISGKTALLLLACLSSVPHRASAAPALLSPINGNGLEARSHIEPKSEPDTTAVDPNADWEPTNEDPNDTSTTFVDTAGDQFTIPDSDNDLPDNSESDDLDCDSDFDDNPQDPGKGSPGIGDGPLDMSEYEAAGRTQLTNYRNTIMSRKEDTAIVSTQEEVNDAPKNEAFLFWRENKKYNGAYDSEFKFLDRYSGLGLFTQDQLGFQLPDKTTMVTVRNAASAENYPYSYCNRGSYDPEGRFIIFQDASAKNNNKVPNHVPLNEINMQNFIVVSNQNANNLHGVFLADIQNRAFWGIVRQNYQDAGKSFNEQLTVNQGSKQFDRIMGSPNFSSKFFGLGNHHNAMGSKIPISATIIPRQVPNSGGLLNVWIKFASS